MQCLKTSGMKRKPGSHHPAASVAKTPSRCLSTLPAKVGPVALFFFCCYAATQLALQLRQERLQVVCSNTEARKLVERTGFDAGPGVMYFVCFL